VKEVAISFEALLPVREDDQEAFLVELTKGATHGRTSLSAMAVSLCMSAHPVECEKSAYRVR